MNKTLVITLLSAVIIGGAFLTSGSAKDFQGIHMDIYKSPSCGCCSYYADYLKSRGADVTIHMVDDSELNAMKAKLGIPSSMYSCHTTIVGDYFIEGHVPKEAVIRLLNEKPSVTGIMLPGMPQGSPGMPGSKSGDFVVYGMHEGGITEFMRI